MRDCTRRQLLAGAAAAYVLPGTGMAAGASGFPPLWLVRGRVGSAYLFGQMPPRTLSAWDAPPILEAFAASSALWLENPVFTPDEAKQEMEAKAARLRPTAAEFLPAADLERLRRLLADTGNKPDALDAVAADDVFQILSAIQDSRSGADFTHLPERVFRQEAANRGMPIYTEWASLKEVAHFIPPAPSPIKLQLIRLGMDNLERAGSEELDAWLAGDVAHFDRIGTTNAARYPDVIALMSGQRNGRLARRLFTAMEQPGIHFVCVGIQHVAQPDSLQSFLRAGGASVERVAA